MGDFNYFYKFHEYFHSLMAPPLVISISGLLSMAPKSWKVYRYDSEGRVDVDRILHTLSR